MNVDKKDADRGLYDKFRVERTDGSSAEGGKHESCRYFVLDLDHDPFAIDALRAYADACAVQYPALARDLRTEAGGISLGLAHILRASSPSPERPE